MCASTAHLIEFLRESRSRGAAASFHLLRGGAARRARAAKNCSRITRRAGVRGFRRRARMAIAAGTGARRPKRARKVRKIDGGAAPAGAGQGARGEETCAGAALENLIRKNRMRWLRNRLTRAGTRRARRARLAEYVHVHEEPGGIADLATLRRRAADRRRAAVDRGNVDRRAVSAAGTRASILRRRFPICWAPTSANCRPTSASAWT